MPIGTAAAIIGGAGLLGGALGAFGKQDPQYNFNMGGPGSLGIAGSDAANKGLASYQNSLGAGGAFGMGQKASLDFAKMLQAYSKGGMGPNAQDLGDANGLADTLFKGRQTALNQSFADQLTQANRAAAMAGRGGNDPILRAKLAESQARQQQLLSADQGSFAAQYAMQQAGQRLGYAGQAADVLTQRGTQDLNSWQNLAQMGSQFQNQDYQQRFQVANAQAQGKFMQDQQSTSFAQRLGSSINSGVAGLGMGMQASQAFSGNNPFATTPMTMPAMGASAGFGAGAQTYSLGANTTPFSNYGRF